MTEDSLVDLRCSVVVMRNGQILAVHRRAFGDWVLPGGRPREGEGMTTCAMRETMEETGLTVHPGRCLFVLEVTDPKERRRLVELVFAAEDADPRRPPASREPGRFPEFVTLQRLRGASMHPPLAGYLGGLMGGAGPGNGGRRGRVSAGTTPEAGAPYLGNLWRPTEAFSWDER
jgi:8-oxo-dGTP pyrophosphatase MutT (NUDIX family)